MTYNQEQHNNYKNRATSGLLWTFLERFGAQCVTLIVSIILARLLDPVVFGTVAIVTVFMEILNVFIDSGLGNALIQKKDADDIDFSSVFYFNIFMCIALYLVLFFLAPLMSRFYGMAELTDIIRVMGLSLIVSGVRNIQRAFVSRKLQFKRFFFATIGGTLGAAVLGIWMAYRGFGVWALVAQGLFNSVVGTVILWLTVKWRPKRVFSFTRFRGLFSFGWKLLVSDLINTVYNNLRQLIIGKMYTTQSLAMYNRGYMIPNVFVININSAIDSVLFPVMSSAQDDVNMIRAMTRRSIRVSSYIMWPVMMGIAACSTPLVSILLTDKWLPCVPFLIIFCISYAFLPLQTANLNAIKALGRSEIYLKLEIIKKIVGFAILAATMWFGPLVMAASNLLFAVINYLINAFPNRKLLNYSYGQQIMDAAPPMLLSAFMFGIVYCVRFLELSNWLTLIIQIPLGVLIYVGGTKLFKLDSFDYILGTVKGLICK
ncbi:MAG: lipopolysaccharide biosynthesis protein [Oscillospiraceae bacterium]|nr:lipopolysaccharide biosynthesis protein [Oscillospiraceae bacterium]